MAEKEEDLLEGSGLVGSTGSWDFGLEALSDSFVR